MAEYIDGIVKLWVCVSFVICILNVGNIKMEGESEGYTTKILVANNGHLQHAPASHNVKTIEDYLLGNRWKAP